MPKILQRVGKLKKLNRYENKNFFDNVAFDSMVIGWLRRAKRTNK